MARRINAAWIVALGAMLMMMAAQPHASAQSKPATAKPKAAVAKAKANESVTWTGCLQTEQNMYRLTDLKGAQVPKGRSWKRGFLMKTTKDVRVVGASNSVNLKAHVGRQVTVVGVRNGDSQIRATSVKRMSASCS